MSKYRVIIKPEEGEVLSRLTFESEEEADQHIAGVRSNADDMFMRTTKNLLIVVKEGFFADDWREITRESVFR